MKKILLLILYIVFLSRLGQVFAMDKPDGWDGLSIEIKSYLLEQYATNLILNREFKFLKKLNRQKLVNTQFAAILDSLFIRDDNQWINNLANSINSGNGIPISRVNLAQILLNKTRFNKFIANNKIDLGKANELGKKLLKSISNSNVVQALIKKGANINFQDLKNGWAPLIKAIYDKHTSTAIMLIGAGANPNLKNERSYTALMYAVEKGYTDIVRALIMADANLDLQNKYGATALMQAIKYGYIDIVKILIVAGANLDLKDNSECTALMRAIAKGHDDAVEILMAAGAN